MTPHFEIQPETPLPVPSTDASDTPMPVQPDDETTPWVYQKPDTPADIPQQFVPSPPIQVPPSREESNVSTGDAILPPSIPPPWFDETRPPPSTTVAHAPQTPAEQRSELDVPDTVSSPSKLWRSGTLHPETPVSTTASPSTARRRWRAGVFACLASLSQTSRQTGGSSRNNRDTKDVPCWMKGQGIGHIQFHSPDARQRKKSVLHKSLQNISGCCLRPWHVNGGSGRSTRQHCH